MAELGDDKDKIHLKVLEQLTNYKIFVTGKIYNRISKKINSKNIVAFNNIKDFPKGILSKMLFEGKNLYFKGSRSSKMESYIEALIND
jgi:UDP-N-acetylmuramyl pentapeptide synthase